MLTSSDYKFILTQKIPLLDVRAPVEFEEGHIPGSINLPLLDNEQRAQVGTCYKKNGKTAAISLGHQLVSGHTKKEREKKWSEFLLANPQAMILCFRGGLRSSTVQSWMGELGIQRFRVEGGFKALRKTLMNEIDIFIDHARLLVVGGMTGSGKTQLLREMKVSRPILDLEFYANHRGSAFGGFSSSQPSQVTFENRLAMHMMKLDNSLPILIEDESRLIGKNVQPEKLFQKLRSSPVVFVEEPLSERVDNCFADYILNSSIATGSREEADKLYNRYEKSLHNISKRLGGVRTQIALGLLRESRNSIDLESNKKWIHFLLNEYYDPQYCDSIKRRKPNIEFTGTRSEVRDYLTKSVK